MRHKIVWIVVILNVLQACSIGASGVYRNETIEKEIRDEMKELNDRFFKAIASKDIAKVRSFMSDELLKSVSKKEMDSLMEQLMGPIQSDAYRVLDQYYVSNLNTGVQNILTSNKDSDNAYKIVYKALDREMYTVILIPEGQVHDIMVMAIYGKTSKGWKINILNFGQYKIFHKTAPEYYKMAKEAYHHSEMIDAVSYISMAKNCSTPGGKNFIYNSAPEITEFYNQVMKEANKQYSLPKTLSNIPSQPKLFRVYPEVFDDGVFPMVNYVSKIDFDDTITLRLEYEQVKREVNGLFSGINRNKKYVLYRAYKEIPDGMKMVKYYGFVDKVEE